MKRHISGPCLGLNVAGEQCTKSRGHFQACRTWLGDEFEPSSYAKEPEEE